MRDEFSGGKAREAVSNFWKPYAPGSVLVGKLDRIEGGGKFGDRAIFNGVLLDPEGTPTRSGEILLGISANLTDRLNAGDSGSYFRIDYTGTGEAKANQSPPRFFDVRVFGADEVPKVRKAITELASQVVAGDAPDTDDDLPF